jgi:hypothetical protein
MDWREVLVDDIIHETKILLGDDDGCDTSLYKRECLLL